MPGLKLNVDFPPCSDSVLRQPEFQFPGISVCLQLNLAFSFSTLFCCCCCSYLFFGGGG